jgi:hypothetical protein
MVNVPAVCPYRACRAVLVGLPGSKLLVFTATLRPFTETDVSSRLSGSFLRGLARDDLILPNAFVPAFNRTLPLTATSWSSFAVKVLPTGSFEETELTVCTASVVPAGIAAAFREEATAQAQLAIAIRMNVFLLIFRFLGLWLFRALGRITAVCLTLSFDVGLYAYVTARSIR